MWSRVSFSKQGRGREEDENFVEKLIGEASKNFMGADTGICRPECLSLSREERFNERACINRSSREAEIRNV